jgi:hypothetical protein
VQGRCASGRQSACTPPSGGRPPATINTAQQNPATPDASSLQTQAQKTQRMSDSMKASIMLLVVVGCGASCAAAAAGKAFQCGAPYALCGESLPDGVTCEEKGVS